MLEAAAQSPPRLGGWALSGVFVEALLPRPKAWRGGAPVAWSDLRGFPLPCNFPPYTGRISRPSSISPFPWLSWPWRKSGTLISVSEAEVGVLEGRNTVRDLAWHRAYPAPQPGPCGVAPILQVRKLRQGGQSTVLGPQDEHWAMAQWDSSPCGGGS